MSKATSIVRKAATPATAKPARTPHLFYLCGTKDHPSLDPNPRLHLSLLGDNLKTLAGNLKRVEDLAWLDEDNHVVHAMSYGLLAALEHLDHLREVLANIESAFTPWPAGR